jgi:hypothetical protein
MVTTKSKQHTRMSRFMLNRIHSKNRKIELLSKMILPTQTLWNRIALSNTFQNREWKRKAETRIDLEINASA